MTSSGRPMRALAYADVDLNSIDGSAIWLQSMVLVLARAGCDVTVQLKAKIRSTLLVEPLLALDSVRIIEPSDEALRRHDGRKVMTAAAAATTLRHLDADRSFDLIVIRGIRIARELAGRPEFRGRLWTYLTDLPQSADRLDPATREALVSIVESSRFMMCQTEDLRSFLEHVIPEAVGKTFVVPPGRASAACTRRRLPLAAAHPARLLRQVRAGMEDAGDDPVPGPARRTRHRGGAAHGRRQDPRDPSDPDVSTSGWSAAPRRRLVSSGTAVGPGDDAMALASTADIGLSWRDRVARRKPGAVDQGLEYGAVGLPVVLNRTPDARAPARRRLSAVRRYGGRRWSMPSRRRPTRRSSAVAARALSGGRGRVHRRSGPSSGSGASSTGSTRSAPALAGRTRPLRIVVASHDLKFFSRLLEQFQSMPELEIRVDAWPALDRHDPEQSRELNDWADVVICEWCGPNAVWYAKHKRTDQRLFIRLHRFELYRAWPEQLAIENVDRIICVSPSYAQLTLERTGWPARTRSSVIPNWVDVERSTGPSSRAPGSTSASSASVKRANAWTSLSTCSKPPPARSIASSSSPRRR